MLRKWLKTIRLLVRVLFDYFLHTLVGRGGSILPGELFGLLSVVDRIFETAVLRVEQLTNDGEIVNKILRVENNHEKEYIVTVDKPVTGKFIQGMRQGVPILGTVTKKCRVFQTEEKVFKIILTQGLNRQIRRMCEYFGYRVTYLRRTRIMNLKLQKLRMGEWRELTEKEVKGLTK